MSEIKWYKRDPARALGGFMGLTLEERGAYCTVLELIYDKADQLRDDDRFIAGWCGCDVRVWRRLKARLTETGKIVVDGGFVRNSASTSGVDDALSRIGSARDAANIRWDKEKRRGKQNKQLEDASAKKPHMQSTTRYSEPKGSAGPDGPPDLDGMIFKAGLEWLASRSGRAEGACRALLGKWRKQHGAEALIAALSAGQREGPIEPVAWMERALVSRAPRGKVDMGKVVADDPWEKRVADYRDDLTANKPRPFWPMEWGRPPGEQHCAAPTDVLARHGFTRSAA